MKLVKPSVKYKLSFLEALLEFQAEGREKETDYNSISENFDEFVEKLIGYSRGENLPEGYVPSTTFWLVDGDEYIGNVNIRHSLNEFLRVIGGHIGYAIRPSKRRMGYGETILKLALPHARKLGIHKALVTCDETNIGSRRIIEKNGGILESVDVIEKDMPRKMRFWVKT